MTQPTRDRRSSPRGGLARRRPGLDKVVAEKPGVALAAKLGLPPPLNARRIAIDVLDRVLGSDHRPFDETFQGHPLLAKLPVRDRAFARLLVTTVLRRLGQIDQAALPLLRYRPKDLPVTNMLRLGAAQLLFLSRRRTQPWPRRCGSPPKASGARCRC